MDEIWIALACGAGTFLLRYLPMRWNQQRSSAGWRLRGSARKALDAIGPAAIAALLVAALASMVSPATPLRDVVSVACGVAGVLVGKRLAGGIVGATVAGVAAYAAALWLWTL